jgi:wobble nucleotide-excising tRNase
MIRKIDIQKFGLFSDYNWDKAAGTENEFQRLNIIYGRNYSGKTTLARIFKCVEDGEIHPDYQDANFAITLKDGSCITQNNLTDCKSKIQIRVYNTDFIRTNLSWLHNDDGTIRPFTILGSKNVELDNKIKEIEEKLGNEEGKRGLLFELSEKKKKYNTQFKKFSDERSSLESSLRRKANDDIKVDRNLFIPTIAKKTYDINDITSEIERVQVGLDSHILDIKQQREKEKLFLEEPKTNVERITESKPRFEEYFSKSKELLRRQIKPSEPIQDLINDNLLQEWVRQGIDKHKGKRKTCGFCGGIIHEDLWKRLDAHFSKESEILRKEIETQISVLEDAKKSINDYLQLEKDSFYISLHHKFDVLMGNWTKTNKIYLDNIDEIITVLKKRAQDIFKERELKEISDKSDDILALLKGFNGLIDENNKKTNTLTIDQETARNDLRLSCIAKFSKESEYKKKKDEIGKLEESYKKLEQEKNDIESAINIFSEEKRSLEAQTRDESKGAELVNHHLIRFFGHDELKLVAEGEPPNMKFKIIRETTDAKNLSQGECSLISFCYFIARMDDEIKDDLKNEKLIIYIDDPVSSLDSNHIFFVFSLIDSVIAVAKKYGQLFISTHNLDFLKYLKHITPPKGQTSINHFLIERRRKKNDKKIFLVKMPSHVKNYITEFNYLFNGIYEVYKDAKGDKKMMLENTYNQFYNLPNNMRKFLECYLFYKYPNNEKPLNNLPKLFDDNVPSLVNRVINEYSHLTYIDRGWIPIDVNEAEECATIIIEKIREKDPEQFNALLESVQ